MSKKIDIGNILLMAIGLTLVILPLAFGFFLNQWLVATYALVYLPLVVYLFASALNKSVFAAYRQVMGMYLLVVCVLLLLFGSVL